MNGRLSPVVPNQFTIFFVTRKSSTRGETMAEKNSSKPSNKFPVLTVVIALVALGVIFTVGGFTFAASQEQHDSFCASCHTQPESTFYQRATDAHATDMASFHTAQKVNCIDCHSGVGFTGRISAELMGARNALFWYTGTAKQPAPLSAPIADSNCTKCHADVTQRGFTPKEQITLPGGARAGRGDRANHWHTFLSRWQAAVPGAGTCTSCHDGHSVGTTAQGGFLVDKTVQAQCDACHKAIRTEDGG
jgi:nitrate/TMAO reductase-like tetraheme cytochrome c subunit